MPFTRSEAVAQSASCAHLKRGLVKGIDDGAGNNFHERKQCHCTSAG
ncbi:hypothetical protein RKLH11_1203 [Rhodobacteraceae bacterium KLH11]|nr:hypothetical protein RKLH11_1203 [Rhodobacteraceae bacterium KLH11]